MISLSCSAKGFFSTFTAPSLPTNSIATLVAPLTVIDFSLPKKSLSLMLATCDFESLLQAPMECGFFLA
ncbi:Uncharacterised protein [Vibrio cholerae]|nr:Uncharacterised protein [Vibrio cholerae]